MLKVGLTGSIAVGKSYVCECFRELGCHVLDADDTARDVVKPGTDGLAQIVREFGSRVLQPNGELDRKRLGAVVFADKEKRELLNSIVHPMVIKAQDRWIRELESVDPDGMVVIDAALMIESGALKRFDKIIVVWCKPAIQLARLMGRDKLSGIEAKKRIAAQMPQEEKSATRTILSIRQMGLKIRADRLSAYSRSCGRPHCELMSIGHAEKIVCDHKVGVFLLVAVICGVFATACSEIERPQPEPFYAESRPPARQEFRWSNGKMPKSFDPARAAAPPETDFVRALFEGLTDIDARTLKETPAAAEKWISSDDFRVWTFEIRKDARWSNGRRVTASDFVRSWKRLAALGEKAAHRELFQNIAGMRATETAPAGEPADFVQTPTSSGEIETFNGQPNPAALVRPQDPGQSSAPANVGPNPKTENKAKADKNAEKFGVEATDENTLRVTLEMPDKDFPKLVANPIFRPVYDGGAFVKDSLDQTVVSNGPFIVANIGKDDITLDRSETYWNKSAVGLQHIRFAPKNNPEAALEAYRRGEVDAVTNAEFAPLALKILAPYSDFRQTTHSALNYYQFNTINPPFDDRRIREALAISIDRERLAKRELEGSVRPAFSFLPLGDKKNARLTFDIERAKKLFEEAGFGSGTGFPKIKLLINRNVTQQRVARAVARMWKQNLNLETEIIVIDLSEIETVRASGEYDLVRRGVVLPTVDEAVGMSAIFGFDANTQSELPADGEADESGAKITEQAPSADGHLLPDADNSGIVTEAQAVAEINAIPLYFPISYSLVKPYVHGFEINGLDAPTLRDVRIDSNWQPAAARRKS